MTQVELGRALGIMLVPLSLCLKQDSHTTYDDCGLIRAEPSILLEEPFRSTFDDCIQTCMAHGSMF